MFNFLARKAFTTKHYSKIKIAMMVSATPVDVE